MRELQIQEVLNPDTIHYLFGNLNDLVDFQRRFLIYLEEIGEKPAEEQNFGALFSQMEDQFTIYEPYCSNYFSAQDLVVQEAPKLQKLAGILNPSYELPSMLIKPVQRICKYPLLLNQLIKSTKSDWPHFEDMEEGLESVKRVTEKVNETQRKHENIKVVDDLKRRIDELRNVQIDSFGALLLHDKLVIQQEDESDKEMYVFFFERTMLICKESKDATKNKHQKPNSISIKKKRRASLQPKGLIVMSRIISVRNLSSGEGNWCLRVDWKDGDVHNVVLRFRNEEQISLWEAIVKRRMSPMKSTVSNTQLASMKNAQTTPPPSLRTDDDDEDDENDEEDDEFEPRSRSNSLSAHLLNSISGRPKMPRNSSADHHIKTNNISGRGPIPRTSSSANTHNGLDYYYPASPPPSTPSSPTISSRASQSSSTSSTRSPLADIAFKFMTNGFADDEYKQFPPPPSHINRSQSHSAASPYPSPQTAAAYQQQQQYYQHQMQQLPRLRSQSSPNIHHNNQGHKWEDAPQLPFNSRTLYQAPPSPLDSPVRDNNVSYRTTTNSSRISDFNNLSVPQQPSVPESIKVKLNYSDGIYVIMCSTEMLFNELMEKVERKIHLVANLQPNDVLHLKYQDEDGDLITINSDDDVQMAFESRGNLNTISVYVIV